jgi:hypothetical protein
MRTLALILMLLFSPVVSAEVMDKEFAYSTVLAWEVAWGVLGTIVSFAASRWLPWSLVLVVPVIAVFFIAHLSELVDPHVASAMLQEAGLGYVVMSWVFPMLIVATVICGLVVRHRVRIPPPNHRVESDAVARLTRTR